MPGPLPDPGKGCLWGVYPKTAVGETVAQALVRREAWAGRRFDLVRHYSDASAGSNGVFADPTLRDIARTRLVFESMASRTFAGTEYTWAQVASGTIDGMIHTAGQRMRELGVPILFSFDIEFDGGSHDNEPAVDYVPAWNRVRDIVLNQEGADNAWMVWAPTGYSGNWDKLEAMYPGNEHAIAWDPYRNTPPSGTAVIDTYRFSAHLDALPWLNQRSPRLLAEWGVIADPGRPAWLEGIPAAIKRDPKLVAVSYFDSRGTYPLTDPESQLAFAHAGADPYLNVR